ncbi:MAG: hypothetical protein LBH43_13055 [Treponema sp.]|jgi:hypothetical protein|nr:hypothetical protein [Treponema sp.]
MQKIVMVYGSLEKDGDWFDTTDKVNEFLNDGWKINKIIPLTSAGSQCSINADGANESEMTIGPIGSGTLAIVAMIQLEKRNS